MKKEQVTLDLTLEKESLDKQTKIFSLCPEGMASVVYIIIHNNIPITVQYDYYEYALESFNAYQNNIHEQFLNWLSTQLSEIDSSISELIDTFLNHPDTSEEDLKNCLPYRFTKADIKIKDIPVKLLHDSLTGYIEYHTISSPWYQANNHKWEKN
jgi:hypothetical protein